MDWLLALGLKKRVVECATVCVKSEDILLLLLLLLSTAAASRLLKPGHNKKGQKLSSCTIF